MEFAALSVSRTLVDCAREWSLTDGVIAIDAALNEKKATRGELLEAVLGGRHRVGIAQAARALGLADGRAESPLETRGRLALLASGLPRPELQVEIHDADGFIGRVDAWYDDAAVAVEFDGQVKYTDPRFASPGKALWDEKRWHGNARGAHGLRVRVKRLSEKGAAHGSIGARRCRYPSRDPAPAQPPPLLCGAAGSGLAAGALRPGRAGLSALPAGESGSEVLVPHWLAGAHRTQLAAAVRAALTARLMHPVAAIHLEDVLTELHVAAARDAVWPAPAARVRLATGWDEDVLPVRLSAAERSSVLAVPGLPDALRTLLGDGAGE